MTVEEQIARLAHRGQFDKAGNPYILHVERVVNIVRGDKGAEAVAWLHDVLEDSCFTATLLAELGVDVVVINTVVTLTRTPPLDYADYITTIAADGGLALTVKLADIQDHLANTRCPPSLRPRYEAAQRVLLSGVIGDRR